MSMFPAITVGGQDGVAVGLGVGVLAPTACAAAVDVKHVVHGTNRALHRRRNQVAAIWRAEVAKPGLEVWVRPDDEEIVLSGLIRRQHFHYQLKRPRRHGRC